jgi:hypothetical protein
MGWKIFRGLQGMLVSGRAASGARIRSGQASKTQQQLLTAHHRAAGFNIITNRHLKQH